MCWLGNRGARPGVGVGSCGSQTGVLQEAWVMVPLQTAAWRQQPFWGGNNLPFQGCPTSGVLATQSCLAEYFVAFLIYTSQILAVV